MLPAPRVSIRKKHAARLGCDVVLFKVGPKSRQYRVHLNVICKTSAYLRQIFQPNRKELGDECSICHEDIWPEIEEITYCKEQFGVNFHPACISKWKEQSPIPTKCPHCRYKWNHSLLSTHSLPDVDDRSFEMYVEWLYHARILATPDGEGNCYKELFKAYAVGMRFENKDFCNAILHAIVKVIEEDDDYPAPGDVMTAYEETEDGCTLRELLVDVYTKICAVEDNPFAMWEVLPSDFLRDLFANLMGSAAVEEKTERMEALRRTLPPRVSRDASATGS